MTERNWVTFYTDQLDQNLVNQGAGKLQRGIVVGACGGAYAAFNLLTFGALRRKAEEARRTQ